MKQLFISLSIAVFAVTSSVPFSLAADPEKKEEKKDQTSNIGKQVKMNPLVDTIDHAARKFTYKRQNGEVVTFTATDKSEIKNGDAPAKFEDIKVGDYVRGIRLVKSDTEMEIVKVTNFGPNEGGKKPKQEKSEAKDKSEEKDKAGETD